MLSPTLLRARAGAWLLAVVATSLFGVILYAVFIYPLRGNLGPVLIVTAGISLAMFGFALSQILILSLILYLIIDALRAIGWAVGITHTALTW